MDYGQSDVSTTALSANQFPISEGYTPSGSQTPAAGGQLTAIETGPASTDSAGKRSAPMAVSGKVGTFVDGSDATQGTTTQTKATDGTATSWSVIQLLKGIFDKLLSTLAVTQSGTWNITNVSGTVSLPTGAATAAKQPAIGTAGTPSADVTSVQGVVGGTAQPVSAASLPLPTGAAQEAGHLATIDTSTAAAKTDLDTIVTNTNKIPASPAQEGGNLAILAGIVSSSKAAAKAASGDFADGAIVGIGTTTQTKATDGTITSWSVIQLLKGILDRLFNGTIAVTGTFWQATQPVSGTFWQATQPVSGTVTANAGTGNMGSNLTQVAGNSIAPGNNAVPVLPVAAQGYVAAFGSNAAALTSSTDYSFKWGAGGTTQVNHVMIQNNTTANVNFELDATATAGSPVLAPGQAIFFDVQTLIVHLFQAGTPNVNGSSAGNIIVKGWL